MGIDRRGFLERAAALAAGGVFGGAIAPLASRAVAAETSGAMRFGDGEILSLLDGRLTLPLDFVLPPAAVDPVERDAFLERHAVGPETITPDCNVTLWRDGERLVLFDAGAGTQFVPDVGRLPDRLAAVGVDPLAITDVVLTHAHPDHLWGALDDFDDLAFPEASYHIHRAERDHWLAEETLERTPEARQSFVVGARNRLARLEERLVPFEWGDEVLGGVEAVDTHGHTPGHTSFALHAGGESLLVVGDALTNAAISFARPAWPTGADQDPERAVRTRLALLDRLAGDESAILGFHLPAPGVGRVERADGAYRFVA